MKEERLLERQMWRRSSRPCQIVGRVNHLCTSMISQYEVLHTYQARERAVVFHRILVASELAKIPRVLSLSHVGAVLEFQQCGTPVELGITRPGRLGQ
jgi:hypothetical protein